MKRKGINIISTKHTKKKEVQQFPEHCVSKYE